ncbi:hypothetical protein E0S83_22110 [Salmonella enterica subsp. enterica serovar Mikawasima]|nr:hypothetical protein [Salmonella enterica subsp. enterica serovar Mikawasima]ECE0445549.1 hypothetical protein [Salmonella enterica subsp. enterica serovar Mikawasima]EDU9383684.1 hypothetical protein [Salmonella enterica subsp. enterica serovar Mikawasima]
MFAIVDPPRGCLNHTTKSKDFNPYYVKQTLHHAQSSIKPLISYQKLYTTSELFYSQPQKNGKMSDARHFLIIFSPHA